MQGAGNQLTILLAWLMADFISGLVHWWEDRAIVGASRFEFINGVRDDNERHHKYPGYFLRLSWWGNINTTAPAAWSLAALLWWLGAPAFAVYTLLFLGIGNLVHRWAHESESRLPYFVKIIQKTGLMISLEHHREHHYGENGRPVGRLESRVRYCVMSNWLNPALDKIKFFSTLDKIFGL